MQLCCFHYKSCNMLSARRIVRFLSNKIDSIFTLPSLYLFDLFNNLLQIRKDHSLHFLFLCFTKDTRNYLLNAQLKDFPEGKLICSRNGSRFNMHLTPGHSALPRASHAPALSSYPSTIFTLLFPILCTQRNQTRHSSLLPFHSRSRTFPHRRQQIRPQFLSQGSFHPDPTPEHDSLPCCLSP